MKIGDIKSAYFIGIGGIGMSALARFFHLRGVSVQGYDRTSTVLTRKLEEEGMKIHYDDNLEKLPRQIDIVIYTPAIPPHHSELSYLRELGLPVFKRAEVLGFISREYMVIAVAGTHGKTSTCALLTHVLKTGGLDCTAFIGGIAKNYQSNFVEGNSDWFVVEADEYDRSFLHLRPKIAVLNSLDPDHLDIYENRENMKNAYLAFLGNCREGGMVFINADLEEEVMKGWEHQFPVYTFGLEKGTYHTLNVGVSGNRMRFDIVSPQYKIDGIKLHFPGLHNAKNALVAAGIALELGIEPEMVKKGLESFSGIIRRFDWIVETPEVVFIDDYAHHPEEIKAFVRGVRALYPDKKLTGIFQPHLYSRTRDFAEGFAKALDELDEIILLDIYPAREEPIEGVTSAIIFEQMENENKRMESKSTILDKIALENIQVLLTIGAGDIDTLIKPIKERLTDDS